MCLDASNRQLGLETHTAFAREPDKLRPNSRENSLGRESGSSGGSRRSGEHSEAATILLDDSCKVPERQGTVRLSERKLLARVMEVSLKECAARTGKAGLAEANKSFSQSVAEPGSSKDTTTLERSHSPRNSKSVGTVTQQKGFADDQQYKQLLEAEDVSLSSLSDHAGKAVLRTFVDPCTLQTARAGSDASNVSRLPSASDDLHEADSHHASRVESGSKAGQASIACSGSYHTRDGDADQEDILSRGCSAQDDSLANGHSAPLPKPTKRVAPPGAPSKKGIKRPRAFDEPEEDDVEQAVKLVKTSSSPPVVRNLESSFEEAAALKKGKSFLRPFVSSAEVPRVNEGSLSRACSDARPPECVEPEAEEEEEEEEGEEEPLPSSRSRKVLRKQTRAKGLKRAAPGACPRRSSRVAALEVQADCTEADEDYLPPGEVVEAFQAAGSKRVRASRTRSAALPKPCIASTSLPAPGSLPRSNSRLRWSNSFGSSVASPLTSPAGSRRLRSQPLDVSCLVPDAFAFEPPCAKRAKHSALQGGLAALKLLEEDARSRCTLARSQQSGICKPYPAWHGIPEALSKASETELNCCRELHPADFKLLDDQPVQPAQSITSTAERLGKGPLAKALSASQQAVKAEGPSTEGHPLPSIARPCKALMPSTMRTACESWEERLNTPAVGVFGEPSTCIKARLDRNLQSIWDDLLSRHALETGVLEGLTAWLSPASVD